MLNVFGTNAIISKGYENAPALKFSVNGDVVRFRIGQAVYDTHAENNTRWINFSVKAFGPVCQKIQKMKLKEGSWINFTGRLDEDTWTDETTGKKKSMTVVIMESVEYAGGTKNENKDNEQPANVQSAASAKSSKPAKKPETSANFTGYETPGGPSFFDDDIPF